MRRFLFALAGVLVLVAVPPAGRAARVEADPNKEYVLGPEVGPYVICVKGYVGYRAQELANRLVLHLRRNGWPAYVYDFTPEEKRKAQEWLDDRYKNVPPEARPHKTIHVEPQWGVFVGGYRDFDGASHDVPKVKQAPWPEADKTDFDHFTDAKTRQIYQVSPYAQCIATHNPTVRVEKPDPNAPDPFWKELNAGRPYNLLACGKPWTLAVKQFQATGVVQPRSASSQFLDMLGLGGKGNDVLDASARQAEEVAKVLSGKPFHYKAYVLHTRTGSIVTVGGYDHKDDKELLQTAEKLRGMRFGLDANAIQLFAQPLPMPVPQL
ncbi:MAG TPA: hypothetical protein VFA26_11810 [Gemmataceae bacterium]|nr:hypothetical protein [Gemmataceae bacterium]